MAAPDGPTLDAFVRAWSEPDAAARLALLERSWAQDGTFTDAAGEVAGRAALHERIGRILADAPGRTLTVTGPLDGLGGRRGFRWRLRQPDGTESEGFLTATAGDDGLLSRAESFVFPPPEEQPGSLRDHLRAWAQSNPLPVAGLIVLALYLVLRFQAVQFYEDFGATPEEAGFGPVELVMRQATQVFLDFAGVGLLWSAGFIVGAVPPFALFVLAARVGPARRAWEAIPVFFVSLYAGGLVVEGLRGIVVDDLAVDLERPAIGLGIGVGLLSLPRFRYRSAVRERAETRAFFLRWTRWMAVFGTVAFGGLMFVAAGLQQAADDAERVKSGGSVMGRDYPWQARPVHATWKAEEPPFALPPCQRLVYLGADEDRLLLWDRGSRRTLRPAAGDVALAFPASGRC